LSLRELPEGGNYGLNENLHLFLSIVILILLLRLFAIAPTLFDTALFSCISMPAMYAMTYYHYHARRGYGRFVVRRDKLELFGYEMAALITSFIMGYLVFTALTGSYDLITYSSAFVAVQLMRVMVMYMVRSLRGMGVDVNHPLIVVLVSVMVALIGLVGLALTTVLLP